MRKGYDELIPALKRLLPPRRLSALGREVGFIRRLRAIRASLFVWAVVLSRFGSGRPGFSEARGWYQRLGGRQVWPRPFQKRFHSHSTVVLFEQAFENAVRPWRERAGAARHPLAKHFPDVVVLDSTVMQVADSLQAEFQGIRMAKASVKAVLGISVFGLLPVCATVAQGSRHDSRLLPRLDIFQPGTLFIFDKGYVASYATIRTVARAGHFFLSPMRADADPRLKALRNVPARVRSAFEAARKPLRLRSQLPAHKPLAKTWDFDGEVKPGFFLYDGVTRNPDRTPIPVRVVLLPGPRNEQRAYYTNLPPLWTPFALREMYRLRWQIELVFKELKQYLALRSLPSKNANAVRVFVWASLLALVLSRAVAGCLQPLATLVGLASRVRPALVSRALRSTLRLLAGALVGPLQERLACLRLFFAEVHSLVRTSETTREDSFHRLRGLLPAPP